ncbi:hypothetical protein DER45DRAFT_622267 [Fusarium avenaceum]|nr:hypothetical protein DER45DRAFT_622267 [Fusarium avenaceum]
MSPSKEDSAASSALGNVGNDGIDRSQDTATTRKQQRLARRQTLSFQAEMSFGQCDPEELEEKGKKAEKKVFSSSPGTSKTTTTSGLTPSVYQTPPVGESEFSGPDGRWWKRGFFKLWFASC